MRACGHACGRVCVRACACVYINLHIISYSGTPPQTRRRQRSRRLRAWKSLFFLRPEPSQKSFRTMQFRGPAWPHFWNMCAGRGNKQLCQCVRAWQISDATLHGKKRFWFAPLLSPAPSGARLGGPGKLSVRWPVRPIIFPFHAVSRPSVVTCQDHVCCS